MSPTSLELVGLVALVLGLAAMVGAAWLLAGTPAALVVSGVGLIFGGFAAVRAAALAEKESP